MRNAQILAALFMIVPAAAAGTILHVPATYQEIQDAVDAAQVGDTVQVAAGTYSDVTHPATDTDPPTMCAVIMKTGITLRGAGMGSTIIDAQNAGRGIHCGGVTDARIENLTVTGAFAEVKGAAILCRDDSSPVISHCEITGNGDGGIICIYASSPTIEYCSITNNENKEGGGILLEDGSSPTISYCEVTGNSAPSGGGIFMRSNSAPSIEHCIVADNFLNTTNGGGGGIGIDHATPTIRFTEITGNTSTGTGGGIDVKSEAVALISDCLIQGNSTEAVDYGPGGGVFNDYSSMTLERCTIARNTISGSGADGGGIYVNAAFTVEINECTIAANSSTDDAAGLGGGISCSFTSPVIDRTIIAFNEKGLGLYCDDFSDPVTTCSDFFGNEDGDGICGIDGGANFSADPLFCDLANDDYRLDTGSPCLPGNHPQGADCGNIGAQGPCSSTGVFDVTGAVTGLQVLPNPFVVSTAIDFELGRGGPTRLAVYDLAGRQVRLLVDRTLLPGHHRCVWNSRDGTGQVVPSGIYFYRLEVAQRTEAAGRLILAR